MIEVGTTGHSFYIGVDRSPCILYHAKSIVHSSRLDHYIEALRRGAPSCQELHAQLMGREKVRVKSFMSRIMRASPTVHYTITFRVLYNHERPSSCLLSCEYAKTNCGLDRTNILISLEKWSSSAGPALNEIVLPADTLQ